MQKINSFSGDYAFLSNFYPAPIVYQGIGYPTVEHAYQAAKTPNFAEKMIIASAETPGKAKKMGSNVLLYPDWNSQRIQVMRILVGLKFEDPYLREKLDNTAPLELIEGNWWNDKFWGVCNGEGKNHLGKILMEIRDSVF